MSCVPFRCPLWRILCIEVMLYVRIRFYAYRKKMKNEHLEFWGELGDMLISSYNVNLSSMGSVHCSPLINPVLLDYSHSRGFSYKQKFKYSRLFHDGRILRISPQIGYNFDT